MWIPSWPVHGKLSFSVTEVGFQKSWSDFYVASTPGGLISSDDKKKWYSCMNSFLSNVGKWFLKYVLFFSHSDLTLIYYFSHCYLVRDTALSFLGLRHILHYMEITTSYITNVQDDDQWASQSEHLINIMHHLLSILDDWFRFNLLNEVPATAIDWETLEALVGNGGAESEWWTRLRGLLFRGSDFGRFGNTIVEDIEAVRSVLIARAGRQLTEVPSCVDIRLRKSRLCNPIFSSVSTEGAEMDTTRELTITTLATLQLI